MSWSVGFDEHWQRDIGYGVPAECDHTECTARIHRGLSFVCGGEPYGGSKGCGLYFCSFHLYGYNQLCSQCNLNSEPFKPKPDVQEWVHHKATDPSWEEWRNAQHDTTGTST